MWWVCISCLGGDGASVAWHHDRGSYSYAAPSRVGAFEVHLVQGVEEWRAYQILTCWVEMVGAPGAPYLFLPFSRQMPGMVLTGFHGQWSYYYQNRDVWRFHASLSPQIRICYRYLSWITEGRKTHIFGDGWNNIAQAGCWYFVLNMIMPPSKKIDDRTGKSN